MKIFLTGSSGRVGRAVMSELLAHGHRLIGFDLVAPPSSPLGFTHFFGSLSDVKALGQAMGEGDFDAVVHLGALMSWNDADIGKMYDSNVTGTFNLLSALNRKRPPKFIFISSGETYPEGKPEYLPVDERHPQRPLSFYGETKLLGERLVEFYGRKYGMHWKILRISHTQDASELLDPASFFSGARFFLKAKIARGKLLGKQAEVAILEKLDVGPDKLVLSRGQDGTPYMMHITETRDTAHGIVLALESDEGNGEAFNIGFNEPFEFDAAIPMMGAITGLEVVDVCLPGAAVHYRTSNFKARHYFGYKPEWDLSRMLGEAGVSWRKRNV